MITKRIEKSGTKAIQRVEKAKKLSSKQDVSLFLNSLPTSVKPSPDILHIIPYVQL